MRRAGRGGHGPQNAGFIYAENAVRANIVLHPSKSDDAPDLPNIKAGVFEVRVAPTAVPPSHQPHVTRRRGLTWAGRRMPPDLARGWPAWSDLRSRQVQGGETVGQAPKGTQGPGPSIAEPHRPTPATDGVANEACVRGVGPFRRGQAQADPEYAKLSQMAEAEAKDNALEQARQRSRPIVYGQTVQIRHVYSNRYMYVSTGEAARLDNLNMQVNLIEAPSKRKRSGRSLRASAGPVAARPPTLTGPVAECGLGHRRPQTPCSRSCPASRCGPRVT